MMEEMTFETAISRLEAIVQMLDGGEKPLSEAMALFEEGIGLARFCSGRLTDVQGRVEMLTKTPEGTLTQEPFEF